MKKTQTKLIEKARKDWRDWYGIDENNHKPTVFRKCYVDTITLKLRLIKRKGEPHDYE